MIIRYSPNIFRQILGIAFYNRKNILLMLFVAIVGVCQYMLLPEIEWTGFTLPVVPVSILGGALAIFLGFRNNSAYDRWWEARKIWGGIVNSSRAFTSSSLSFGSSHHKNLEGAIVRKWHKETVYRHIAWLYALKMHLRKENKWSDIEKYLSPEEYGKLNDIHNKPAQILHWQNSSMRDGFEMGIIDNFRHMELSGLTTELYGLQGMAERIKSTVFPYYYNYFTVVFLWLFIICLPFALVQEMGWGAIPMSFAISFVFTILEKSGSVTEDPFESRAADTPISTIVRNIEIDLLEMLGDEKIPAPVEKMVSNFGVEYMT